MCCQLPSHWLVWRTVSPGSGSQLTFFSSWISEFLSFLWFVFMGTLLGNWKRLFQALLTRYQLKLEPHTCNCKRRWPTWTSRIHSSMVLWPAAQAVRQQAPPALSHPRLELYCSSQHDSHAASRRLITAPRAFHTPSTLGPWTCWLLLLEWAFPLHLHPSIQHPQECLTPCTTLDTFLQFPVPASAWLFMCGSLTSHGYLAMNTVSGSRSCS